MVGIVAVHRVDGYTGKECGLVEGVVEWRSGSVSMLDGGGVKGRRCVSRRGRERTSCAITTLLQVYEPAKYPILVISPNKLHHSALISEGFRFILTPNSHNMHLKRSKSEDGERIEGMLRVHPTERNAVLHETRQYLQHKQPCTHLHGQLRTGHGYFKSRYRCTSCMQ